MKMDEVIAMVLRDTSMDGQRDGRNVAVGLAVAGKLIADAIDRRTLVQEKQAESVAGLIEDYKKMLPNLGEMLGGLGGQGDGEKWKHPT